MDKKISEILQALSDLSQELGLYDDDQQDINRNKQIKDLKSDVCTQYSNTPTEAYAGIESVTDEAGGGANGPKHPADIRAEHPSLYAYLTQLEHERGKH